MSRTPKSKLMKTTNKILLSAFLLACILMVILMLHLRSNLSLELVEGSGHVIQSEREVTPFKHLTVRGMLEINIRQAPEHKLYITADDNLMDLVIIDIVDQHLHIHLDKAISKASTMNISIYLPDLNGLFTSAGGVVQSEGTLRGGTLVHHIQTGSQSELHLDYQHLDLNMQAGAISKLHGQVQKANIRSQAGAILNARTLEIVDCQIDARLGSVNNLWVSGSLSGEATSGAVVNYAGEPDTSAFRLQKGGVIDINIDSDEW